MTTKWAQICLLSGVHCLYILSVLHYKAWLLRRSNLLFLPLFSVTQLEDRFAYRQITIGGDFTCVYLQEINSNPVRSFLKCFGLNNLGQLGLGDTNDRGDQFGEMGNNLPTVCLD